MDAVDIYMQEVDDGDFTLHSRSKRAFESILDLNMSPTELDKACAVDQRLVWKVLIMDKFAQDVVSPLLHLGDLRHHNVTLHLQLQAQRQPLHDVTAVYVMLPTTENIGKLEEDCRSNLYDLFQVNFLEPLTEEMMEKLARAIAPDINRLHKVYDHNLAYLVMEPKLFQVMGPSWKDLSEPQRTDREVQEDLHTLSRRIYTVLRSLKVLPIIRAGSGFSKEIAPLVAELCASTANEESHPSRPLLLIVDRDTDLGVMLHHPWTYEALITDLLEGALNKVVLPGTPPKVYELNHERDDFWAEHSSNSFDLVLQAVDQHFKAWKLKYDSVGTNISAAMESMPEITEKKDQLDMHTSLATYLVDQVRKRKLDKFNSLEEEMIKGHFDSRLFDSLMETAGEEEKERTLIIGLVTKSINKEQARQLGLSSEILTYLEGTLSSTVATEDQSTLRYLSSIAGKMKGKLQQFYGDEFVLPLTQLVHLALEHKATKLGSYFDPKHMDSGRLYKRQFNEAIVFVVGGGNYAEYHDLQKYAERTGKKLIYGSTDLPSPKAFLEQIKELANR